MSNELGYKELFDREFYSCLIGSAKPDADFFHFILKDLATKPGAVLFLDDHEINVTAARSCGIHAEIYDNRSGLEGLLKIFDTFGVST